MHILEVRCHTWTCTSSVKNLDTSCFILFVLRLLVLVLEFFVVWGFFFFRKRIPLRFNSAPSFNSVCFPRNICAQWNETLKIKFLRGQQCLLKKKKKKALFEDEASTYFNWSFIYRCWMCLKMNASSNWWWRSMDLVWTSLHLLIINPTWMSH